MWRRRRGVPGFTLIELLIVVAIIGILAAVAIPNFLNAKTRSTVARVMADMNALGRALAMFRMDNKQYPGQEGSNPYSEMRPLTTPVPYITRIPADPFRISYGAGYHIKRGLYISTTTNYDYSAFNNQQAWLLHSLGPDWQEDVWSQRPAGTHPFSYRANWYDASNGVRSRGNIIYTSEKFFD